MTDKLKKEVEKLIEKEESNCSTEEFQDKVEWSNILYYQTLSEDFIRGFQDKINWKHISIHQTLPEDFIREFKNKLDLDYLLETKKISEEFYNSLIHEKVNRFELMDI